MNIPELGYAPRVAHVPPDPTDPVSKLKVLYPNIARPFLFYLVLLPNLLSLIYFGLIASPVYVSHSSALVFNPGASGSSLTSMLSGGSGDGSSQGAFLLQDYLGSWDAFRQLDRQYDLANVYRKGDFVGRYSGVIGGFQSNDLALWRYYRNHVGAEVDTKSGIASITVEGYAPNFAQKLASTLLAISVRHLTAMAGEQQQNLVTSTEARKKLLEQALSRDNQALAQYRARSGYYDPKERYVSNLALINALIAREAELQSQYDTARAATPGSPDVKNLSVGLASIQARLAEASQHATQVERDSSEYDSLAARRDNDLSLLQHANMSGQEAAQKVDQNQYYLNIISAPSLPQTPELPHSFEWMSGILLASLLLWGLLR